MVSMLSLMLPSSLLSLTFSPWTVLFDGLSVGSHSLATLILFHRIYTVASLRQGDTIDYQKQLKQMIKDLAKEKDKMEKELPKMSQVRTVLAP